MRGPVVIGVDWSAAGRSALRWAGYLAATWNDYLVPVTVLADSLGAIAADRHDAVRQAWLADLHNWCTDAGSQVRLRPRVRAGRPAAQLLSIAEQQMAGALVVGRDGRRAAEGAQSGPGSVTFRVAHQATVPLVVVPATAADPPLTRVVVGNDGSAASSGALVWATSLAAQTGAALTVVHVTPTALRGGFAASNVAKDAVGVGATRVKPAPTAVSEHGWNKAVIGQTCPDLYLVESGRPAEALLGVAAEQGAELLVVGRRGARSVCQQHLGAVAVDLLHETDRALAIIPAAAD